MPIWLRRFTFNTIRQHYENLASKTPKADNQNYLKRPDISPTYSTKASK